MAGNVAPFLHNTKAPLDCCDRCRRAELAGRALKRPVFRYSKLEIPEGPGAYEVFHGDCHIATFTRRRNGSSAFYGVRAEWDPTAEETRAITLKDARAFVEEAYTSSWREGWYAVRGPVLER